MTEDEERQKAEAERREKERFEFDRDGFPPQDFVPSTKEAEVTLTTQHIERILSNFVALRGGVRTPFAYTIKWLWSIDKGPLAHVSVREAPEQVRPMPGRVVRKKGTSKR